MIAWFPWRLDARYAQIVLMALRRGTRLSHTVFSIVGCAAVLTGAALWLQPAWRVSLATQVMPFVSAAVEAGPARLLAGQPVPRVVHADELADDRAMAPETPLAGAASALLGIGPGSTSTAAGAPTVDGAAPGHTASVALTGDVLRAGQLAGTPFSMNAVGSTIASTQPGAVRTFGNVAAFNALIMKLDPHPVPSFSVLSPLPLKPAPQAGVVSPTAPAASTSADGHAERTPALSHSEQLVASYLARRYRVAHQPVNTLVKAAFDTGSEVGLDPLLLLAVMAIESGFNPYAESGVGAQGLMQVMSKVHSDKFQYFGGPSAALQPLANIKVGALVLKDCIQQGGSVPGGLRRYVGATTPDDGGYGAKVLAERGRLHAVVSGRNVPINGNDSPLTASAKPAAKPAAAKVAAVKNTNAAAKIAADSSIDADTDASGGTDPTSAVAPSASRSHQNAASAQADAGVKPHRVRVELGV